MCRDRWTAAEYRQYLETGREPAGRNERQQRIEEAYAKAERERRVMTLDIPADAAPKKSKYGNEKETEDGITFDSKHEHNVYRWLKARKDRGELRGVLGRLHDDPRGRYGGGGMGREEQTDRRQAGVHQQEKATQGRVGHRHYRGHA